MTEEEWLDKTLYVEVERKLLIPEETRYGTIKAIKYMILYANETQLQKEIEKLENLPNTMVVLETRRKTNREQLRDDLEYIYGDEDGNI